ncbi:hypothetical protein ABZP36_004699 [Zizania latifolia]
MDNDLHISAYNLDHADNLSGLLGPALLRTIRPHELLVTGDITDAKNRGRSTSRQDEKEWITYKNATDAIVGRGGSRIFDIGEIAVFCVRHSRRTEDRVDPTDANTESGQGDHCSDTHLKTMLFFRRSRLEPELGDGACSIRYTPAILLPMSSSASSVSKSCSTSLLTPRRTSSASPSTRRSTTLFQ